MTLVERLKKKFVSHNSVPITSIRISREEFDEIEQRIDELASSWIDLVGNASNKDAFGNVTIDEVDYNVFHEMIEALTTQDR
jgi:hypothetical protein